MRKFRGSVGILMQISFMFVMGVGQLWLACQPASHGIWRIAFALLGLLFGGWMGSGLLEWFTVYEVNAEGIMRRAWNGTRRIRWDYLSGYEASGDKYGSLTLMDNQHTKLTIEFSMQSARSRRELHELIAPHLEPLRAARMREIGIPKTVYRPQRGMLIFLGGAAFLLSSFFFGGVLDATTKKPPDGIGVCVFGTTALFVFLVGLWALILGLTRTLTVSPDALTQSSLFGTRTILFDRVTALTIREVPAESEQQGITTVRDADKQKIYLTSKMTDYPLLLELVRDRVPSEALQQGKVQITETLRKEDRLMHVIMPVCLVIMGLVFLGAGIKYLFHSIPILEQQRQIDRQGQTTIGHVTRRIYSENQIKLGYSIEFEFEDRQGRRIIGSSPASYSDFQNAHAGTPVKVEYVRGRPELNRRFHSTSKFGAFCGLALAAVYLFAALVLVPLCFYEVWKIRKAKAAAILLS